MEDLIACLYPFGEDEDGYAHRTVNLSANNSRALAAKQHLPDLPGRGSRESTAPLDDSQDDTVARDVRNGRGLQLTFTDPPKAAPGFILGTDPNTCDIVLPPSPTVSRRHCYLAFDAKRRLIVRDCSTNGTIVTYNGEGKRKQSNFIWIIGGHEVPENTKEIVIQLSPNLKFQIVVSKPLFVDLYLENVDAFLRETAASASLPFAALGIQSTSSTQAPSEAHTPKQAPILLEREQLGKGSFSTIYRVWDVSIGVDYASKRFHNVQMFDWRKEAYLMRQTSHPNIVRLHFVTEEPMPQLILEYLPLGDLLQLHEEQSLHLYEVVCVLVQSLSALEYLHSRTPPIVHRDIKPANLLVQSRDPFHIKLGDFGISKAGEDLETICGTFTYLAPEVAQHRRVGPLDGFKYTCAVDIWSLGVVVSEFAYGLPPPGSGQGVRWCKSIVARLNGREPDELVNILLRMVAMDPRRRDSASICFENALELDYSSQSSTPRPSSHVSVSLQIPQNRTLSPTVKMSTRELNELRNHGSKRQRSPHQLYFHDDDQGGKSTRRTTTAQDKSAEECSASLPVTAEKPTRRSSRRTTTVQGKSAGHDFPSQAATARKHNDTNHQRSASEIGNRRSDARTHNPPTVASWSTISSWSTVSSSSSASKKPVTFPTILLDAKSFPS